MNDDEHSSTLSRYSKHDNIDSNISTPPDFPWDTQQFSLDHAIDASDILQDGGSFFDFLESIDVDQQRLNATTQQICRTDNKTANENGKFAS